MKCIKMKCLLLSFLVVLTISGKAQNVENLFVEFDQFPYTTDAEFYANINESFEELDPSYLRALYENTDHVDENSNDNIVRAFIEIDSLKDNKKWTEETQSEYWEFYTISLVALHKFKISQDIVCYTWLLQFSDMNQGPSKIFMTIYKRKKPYYCFELSSFAYYSDSPVWNESEVEAVVCKDGLVKTHAKNAYGEDMEEVRNWEWPFGRDA